MCGAVISPSYGQDNSRQVTSQIDEIITTAQKRTENAQDVPVAVSAINSAQLEKTFARDIRDVESISPNLIIDSVLGNGTAAISIRGMQFSDVEKSFDPAVAVYTDGVYLANSTGALVGIWDAESVEVLRGPQGTLFGRNTIGGLIHVKRKKPSGVAGGRASITYGSYDRLDLNAAIDLPAFANDTIKLRGMVNHKSGGGYFKGGANSGDADFLGFDLSALVEPTDALSILTRVEIIDDNADTPPLSNLAIGDPGDFEYHRTNRSPVDQTASRNVFAVTVTPTWQINENHTLEAIIAHREGEETAIQDFFGVDGETAFGVPAFAGQGVFVASRPQEESQFSTEVRLHSNFGDRLETVLGGYYWNSEYEMAQSTGGLAITLAAPFVTQEPRHFHETESWAIFGQMDLDVTDRLGLSLGGRYLEETKAYCGSNGADFTGNGTRTGLSLFGQPGLGICDTSDPLYNNNFIDPVSGNPAVFVPETTWTKFTPRVGLTYDIDQAMLYATYSEGFRSGGYNGRASDPQNAGPYEPESVENFELGVKSDLMDNRLRLNLGAFFTKYDNKQEDVAFDDPNPSGTTVTIVQNAASATINGFEAEGIFKPIDALTLNGSIGILDASYDEYFATDTNGNTVDLSSSELRRAPDLTFSMGATYEHQLENGHFIIPTVNYSYRGDHWVSAYSAARSVTPPRTGIIGFNEAYGLLSASINYETDNWRLSLFGDNLLDEGYFNHGFEVATYEATSATDASPVFVPGSLAFGLVNAPITWGVELDVKF